MTPTQKLLVQFRSTPNVKIKVSVNTGPELLCSAVVLDSLCSSCGEAFNPFFKYLYWPLSCYQMHQ